MSRTLMRQVYPAVWESDKVRIARTDRKEYARYSYQDFWQTVLGADLIVTQGTARNKWMIGVKEGVFHPANELKPFGIAVLDMKALADKVGEPYSVMCVCDVCVCSEEGSQ